MRSLDMAGIHLRRSRSNGMPDMGMAPMIDCVFLLLVFFMVATTFSPLPALDVNLSAGSASRTPSAPPPLLVRVVDPEQGEEDGTVLLNDEILSMAELHAQLLSTDPMKKDMLVIQAGRNVSHRQVVALLDFAKGAGFGKIAFLAPASQ